MIVHNLGSINIDLVFRVPHIPSPGETILSSTMSRGLGGKGANTSIAISKSGVNVCHYGAVGQDGLWAVEALESKDVDCRNVQKLDTPTGQAIIQVDDRGENAITLLKGANWQFGTEIIAALVENATIGDWMVLQNETAHVAQAAQAGKDAGLMVAYAAAPFDAAATLQVLPHVDLLALNEIEATQLAKVTGKEVSDLSPRMILVTQGAKGATLYEHGLPEKFEPSKNVAVVADTTGAGDTFFGFFLGSLTQGKSSQESLRIASIAAALSVTKMGAADAIPSLSEVQQFRELN